MLVMLLNVKVHVFVKIEVFAVALIPEGLQLGHMAFPVETTCCPPRRRVCRVRYTCCLFLVLLNFFT